MITLATPAPSLSALILEEWYQVKGLRRWTSVTFCVSYAIIGEEIRQNGACAN